MDSNDRGIELIEKVIDDKIDAVVNRSQPKVAYGQVMKNEKGVTWVRFQMDTDLVPITRKVSDVEVGEVAKVTIYPDGSAVLDGSTSSPMPSVHGIRGFTETIITEEIAPVRERVALIEGETADISFIRADAIKVRKLTAEELEAATGYIGELESENITAQNIQAATGYIGELESENITAQHIQAATGYIGELESENVTAQNITAATGYIADLTSENITADVLTANVGKIKNISGDTLSYMAGYIGILLSNHITTQELYADHGVITNLESNYAQIDMANVNNGWITNGVIKNAAISDEMVNSVSANKLTAGTIDAAKINVANLRAKNLIVEKLNGQPVLGGYELVSSSSSGYSSKNPSSEGWYEYSNGAWTASSDTTVVEGKAYYKDGAQVELYDQNYIDGLETRLDQRIDGAVETFTGSAVPSLVNYPASGWSSTQYQSHVGDIYYVVDPTGNANGYCYRFAYDSTSQTYGWVLIKDSDVTKALSDISDLQTFESNTTSWIEETDEGLTTIRQNHTALSGVVDKTVKSSIQLWYTKNGTGAPNPPYTNDSTNHVTSTSTSGNAWTTVVPAYNASYPNYFYCWQYELADGKYRWSAVIRDIAMEESQATGRYAKDKIDNLKIGGRNLLKWSDATSENKTNLGWTLALTAKDGRDAYLYPSATAPAAWHFGQGCAYEALESDTIYTYSVWVYWTGTAQAFNMNSFGHFQVINNASTANDKTHEDVASKRVFAPSTIPQNKWTRVSVTFVTNSFSGSAFDVFPRFNIAANQGDLYFAQPKLEYGNIATDWTPAPEDMTADMASVASALDGYMETNDAALQALQQQVDGQLEVWYGTANPTTSNAPASGWSSNDAKSAHVGDLYYNTTDGSTWQWSVSGSTYSWAQIPDSSAAAALAAAQDAQATADGKRRIFTTTPTVPYDKGDLWVKGNEVRYANVKRETGSYVASEWSLTATDDTMAKTNIKSSVMLWYTSNSTTPPGKPYTDGSTSYISSTSTGAGTWTTVVPTYASATSKYHYCYQQQRGDGKYQWTTPVYDDATTTAMAKAQAALPASSFTTFQTTTFKELVDEVDEQSSTITTLSETVQHGGTNLVHNSGTYEMWFRGHNTYVTFDGDVVDINVPNDGANHFTRAFGWLTEENLVSGSIVVSFEVYSDNWAGVGSPDGSSTGFAYTVLQLCYRDGSVEGTSVGTVKRYAYMGLSNSGWWTSIPAQENSKWIKFVSKPISLPDGFTSDTSKGTAQHITVEPMLRAWGHVRFRHIKVEKGTIATPWDASPMDIVTTSNTVNSVKQTADTNLAKISNLTTTLGTNADGTTKSTDVVHRMSSAEQTLDGFTNTVSAIANSTVLGDNILTGNALNPYNWTVSAPSGASFTKTAYGTAGAKIVFSAVSGYEILYSPAIAVTSGKTYTLTVEYTVEKEYIPTAGRGGYGLGVYKAAPPGTFDNANANYVTKAAFQTSVTRNAMTATVTFTAPAATIYLALNGGQINDGQSGLTFTIDKLRLCENVSSRMSAAETKISQTAGAIGLTASGTATIANPSLAPFFESQPFDTSNNSYWISITNNWNALTSSDGYTFEYKGDGWMRVVKDNTSGSSDARLDYVNVPINGVNPNTDYTFLFEMRNWTNTSGSNNRIYVVQNDNCQFWGGAMKKLLEGNRTVDSAIYYSDLSSFTGSVYRKRFVKTSEAEGSTHWTNGSLSSVTKGVNLVFYIPAGSKMDLEFRPSLYEGEYMGPWKPYSGNQLYASQAELKVASDEISTKVSKNGVISSINQSAEEITIDADRVNIAGAALFTSGGALSKVVTASQTEWYSSTSKTALSGGSWSTSQPTLAKGRYTWQRTKITYSDSTTAYSPGTSGVCISQDPNIGGRNLLPNTGSSDGYFATTTPKGAKIGPVDDGGSTCYKRTSITANEAIVASSGVAVESMIANTVYTESLMVKSSVARKFALQLRINSNETDGGVFMGGPATDVPANTWTKLEHTFTASSASSVYARLYTAAGTSCDVSIKNWQLEKGSVATDWSYDSADDMKIGARNLVRGTQTMTAGSGTWSSGTFRASGGTVSNATTSGFPIPGITGALRCTNTGSSAADVGYAQDTVAGLIVGEEYTESAWIRASTSGNVVFQPVWNSSSNTPRNTSYFPVTTSWQRFTWTARLGGTQGSAYSIGCAYMLNCPAGEWFEICGLKVERGSKATDWSIADEDITLRTQRIYYRTQSSSAPTAPATWVTETGNKRAANNTTASNWTTKITSIAADTDAASGNRFLYLWTCTQTQKGDGTIVNSTVVLDDTTTIIDGGKIITGSIDANCINANTINGSTLTISNFKDSANYLNSNVQIGARNLHKRSTVWSAIGGGTGSVSAYDDSYHGRTVTYTSGTKTYRISNIIPETNVPYTVSFTCTASAATTLQYDIMNNTVQSINIPSGTSKVSFTSTPTRALDATYHFIDLVFGAAGTYKLADMMVEQATRPSDWRPAIEDEPKPNLTPFFSFEPYNTTAGQGGQYWQAITYPANLTPMGDGWVKVVTRDNTSGTANTYDQHRPKHIVGLSPDTTYTLMVEFRNVSKTGGVYLRCPDGGQTSNSADYIYVNGVKQTSIDLAVANGVYYKQFRTAVTTQTNYDVFFGLCTRVDAGAKATYEMRLSLYEDVYTGPYQPYAGHAVIKEQRIYYRSNSTTAPAAPTTFVTSTATANSTWSTKRMQYDSTYKYLYTTMQRKYADGIALCDAVLLDDTTTVIDGGNITTGTVAASRIDVSNIQIGSLGGYTNFDNRVKTGENASTKLNYYTRNCHVGNSSNTQTNLWRKFASCTLTSVHYDTMLVLDIYPSGDMSNTSRYGKLEAHVRTGNPVAFESAQLKWLWRGAGFVLSDWVLVYKSTSGTNVLVELWCRCPTSWIGYQIYVDQETSRTQLTDELVSSHVWTLHDSYTADGVASVPPSGYTKIDSIDESNGYITRIDSDGIFVSPSNQSPTAAAPGNSTKITSDGMTIYKDSSDVAFFGATQRIGSTTSGHLVISTLSSSSGTELAFNYGSNNQAKITGSLKKITISSLDTNGGSLVELVSSKVADNTYSKISLSGPGSITFCTNDGNGAKYTDLYSGKFTTPGDITASAGYLKSTLNGNTVTIGSSNTSWCHISNSANRPFWFSHSICMQNGCTIGSGSNYGPTGIELTPVSTAGHGGFIDFHFNHSDADYTSRIIESSSGTLSVSGNLSVASRISLGTGGGGTGVYYIGTKATYSMITFVDNTADEYGNGVLIGGGGLVVIGAGESAKNLTSTLSLSGGDENLHLGADSSVTIYTNCNTIANRKSFAFKTNGELDIPYAIDFSTQADQGLLYQKYNNTWYRIMRNHNNGNISISATGTGLYIGFENTTSLNFLNSKGTMNSSGDLSVTGALSAGGHITSGATTETSEHDIKVISGAGNIYMYAGGSSTGNRGLYGVNAAGTGAAILTVNQSNQVTMGTVTATSLNATTLKHNGTTLGSLATKSSVSGNNALTTASGSTSSAVSIGANGDAQATVEVTVPTGYVAVPLTQQIYTNNRTYRKVGGWSVSVSGSKCTYTIDVHNFGSATTFTATVVAAFVKTAVSSS